MALPTSYVKLHTKGRLITGPNAKSEDDYILFTGGGSTALVKIVEPVSPMLNYYEIEIINKGNECAIGIGIGSLKYPQGRMPGWNRDSMGYHADDGKLFHEKGYGENFGPTCTQGDIMGCGVDFRSDPGSNYVNVFFTKNGKQIGKSRKMKRPVHGLYPLLGLHSQGEKIKYLGHSHKEPETLLDPMEDDSSPSTYWLRSNGVQFMEDGLTLEYAGEGGNIQDVAIAQANTPVTPTNHYFELEIIDAGAGGSVAIGLAKMTYPLNRHPGWNTGAVGYHADDGKLFKEQGFGEEFGPVCSTGDRMGCGIRYSYRDLNDSATMDNYEYDSSDSEVSLPEEINVPVMFDYSDDSDDGGPFGGIPPPGLFGGFRFGQPRPLIPRRPLIKKSSSKSNEDSPKVTVYFTRNGELVGDTECSVPSGGFYPVVAMLSRGEKIRVDLRPITG